MDFTEENFKAVLAENEKLKGTIAHLNEQLKVTFAKLQLMIKKLFGRSSEKLNPDQLLLFQEKGAEVLSQTTVVPEIPVSAKKK